MFSRLGVPTMCGSTATENGEKNSSTSASTFMRNCESPLPFTSLLRSKWRVYSSTMPGPVCYLSFSSRVSEYSRPRPSSVLARCM